MSVTWKAGLRLIAAAFVLYLVLIQPNHPAAMTWQAVLVFPLELPVILIALGVIDSPRARFWTRLAVTATLSVIAILKTADYAMFTALTRGFNPVADLPLIGSALRLLVGAIGPLPATGAVVVTIAAIALGISAIWWATGVWAKTSVSSGLVRPAILAAGLAGALAVAEIGQAMGRWSLPVAVPGAAFTARVGIERVDTVIRTLAELRSFNELARTDPYIDADGLLQAIDRDVLIVFVESYGRTSFDTPFFADTHRDTLARAATRLEGLGLSMRSGVLSAPTRGGQSWLSHATFANGLWISDQTLYGAALASGRTTLFHLAGRAGFRTAAVMPQITLDWPESDMMGFETVLAADDLGYRGLPFNWVTMPDQYTLSALDRLLRAPDGADPRPLFAQVALSSSHAPWVPVPELIDWDRVGDGRVFDAMASAGDPPDVVWRDHDRVRAQYRLAIDYSLRTVFDYVARHAADAPLVMVVGDHQAAGFVALDERADVPIHVIGPRHLVSRVAEWGFTKGLIPAQDAPPIPMDRMRNMILDAFSAPDPKDAAG